MDWETLNYALALGRFGTMSAAAVELGVNHSTVSRRIAALQSSLGVTLFVSTPDGWELTPAGEVLVERGERIEFEVLELDRALLAKDDQVAGTLRITALDVGFTWLAPQFLAFRQRYPHIKLEFVAHNMPINLSRREADIAIRATNNPPETLVGRRVATVVYAAFAARTLVESLDIDAPEGEWTANDLAKLPWLSWDQKMGAVVTEQWLLQNVGLDQIVARYDSSPVMIDHTRAGLGAACLPAYLIDDYRDIVRLTPALEGFEIDLWVLTHPDLRRSARVRAFMDFFEEAISAQRPRLARVD